MNKPILALIAVILILFLASSITPSIGGGVGGFVDANIGFLDLNDTPNSYTGQGGKFVTVDPAEQTLVFTTASPGGGPTCDNNTACTITGTINTNIDANFNADVNIQENLTVDGNVIAYQYRSLAAPLQGVGRNASAALLINSNTCAFAVAGTTACFDFNANMRLIGILDGATRDWAWGTTGQAGGFLRQRARTTFPNWAGSNLRNTSDSFYFDFQEMHRSVQRMRWEDTNFRFENAKIYLGISFDGINDQNTMGDQNNYGNVIHDGNYFPDVNGEGSIGSNQLRWGDIWGKNIHTGDLVFANGMYLSEPDGNTVCLYNNDGNLNSCFSNGMTTSYVPVIQKQPVYPQPACNAGNEGLTYLTKGVLGVATKYEMCTQTALNIYVWTPII